MLHTRFALLAALLLLGGARTGLAHTEKELLATLKAPAAPFAAKAEACRLLQRVGTRNSVPVLAALLGDEKLAHMARYALQPMADPAVDYAFRVALSTLKGRPLLGVIASVATRRDPNAVETLVALLRNEDPEVVRAAARALGAFGTGTAAKALEDAWTAADPAHRLDFAEALLRCAEALLLARQRDPALALYGKLYAPDMPDPVRSAAIRGLILASNDPGDALLNHLQRTNDMGITLSALQAGREVPHYWGITEALAVAAGPAQGERKILILQAIGDTRDPDALPALIRAAKSPDKEVQIAAVRAMAGLGNSAAVPVLAGFAADPVVGPAALETLACLPGPEADAAVIKLFESSDPARRRQGMELIARRRMAGQLPAVLAATRDSNPGTRLVAIRCAGELGGAGELPVLLDLLGGAAGSEFQALEQALTGLVARIDPAQAAAAVQPRLAKAAPPCKKALLRLLAHTGGPKAQKAAH